MAAPADETETAMSDSRSAGSPGDRRRVVRLVQDRTRALRPPEAARPERSASNYPRKPESPHRRSTARRVAFGQTAPDDPSVVPAWLQGPSYAVIKAKTASYCNCGLRIVHCELGMEILRK